MKRILVIDDNVDLRFLLKKFLTRHGYGVVDVSSGKAGLEIVQKETIDLVLCDFKLDDMDGSSVLQALKEFNPAIPVIIITGYSNVKTAVEVMRLGAIDYITKPLVPEEILITIQNMLQASETASHHKTTEPSRAGTAARAAGNRGKEKIPPYIFSNGTEIKNVLSEVDLVGPTDYCVIIYGESGSGKECIAQEIHRRSRRKDKLFMAIDCGTLSKELAGSALFGHEKGAFTGALTQKIGSFELANGGTVFLDEIANLTYDVQVSLLRVVQERKMRRVGGTKDISLDIRIIVASNMKLWDASRQGSFREDLYHRFNEFTISVPPLRERPGDIMFYARHFLALANAELSKNILGFDAEVENIFISYPWYGNLRELRNVVKRATLLNDSEWIDVGSIPFELTNFNKLQFEPAPVPAVPKPSTPAVKEHARPLTMKSATMRVEYEAIINALRKARFNKSEAAKLLNIDRKTLYNKMKEHKELLDLPAAD